MNLRKILFGAVVVIILYIFYTTLFADKTKSSLLKLHDGKTPYKIVKSIGASSNYTYSFWIYINDYNYRYSAKKEIISRGVDSNGSTPEKVYPRIYLGENQNDIHIDITYTDDTGTKDHKIVIKNIPLQRWNHFIMTKSGSNVDIYIDGKLVKTSIIPGTPVTVGVETEIEVAKADSEPFGFAGYLSKLNYFSTAINTREAYSMYKEGYGSGMLGNFFNRFKLKFAFMQDNKETSSFVL
jgi:hypothetical protein